MTDAPLTKVYDAKVGVPFSRKVDPAKFTAPELVMVIRFCSRVPTTVIAPKLIPLEDLLNFNFATLLTVIALAVGKAEAASTIRVPFWISVAPV